MRLFSIAFVLLVSTVGLWAQCSTIYFYRPDGLVANKTLLKLAQNGENITTLRIGDRVKATVCSPGKYRFEAYSDRMLTRGTFDVDISDGKDYYVKVLCPLGSFPSLRVMPADRGENELRRASKFNGNIRTIRVGDPVGGSNDQSVSISSRLNQSSAGYSSGAQVPLAFNRDQTANNFRFRIVEVLRAGKRLILNYEVTNMGGQDRVLYVGNTNASFYDDRGNLLKAKKSCVYNNCTTVNAQEKIYNDEGRFHHSNSTSANVPVGIPIKASIEIGDIRVGTDAFLRGSIFFQARTASNGNIEDFGLSYGKIDFPTDNDPNDPMARIVGTQKVRLTSIEQVDDRIRISGVWTNDNLDPYSLRFAKGALYSERGDAFQVEKAGFGDRALLSDKQIRGVYSNKPELAVVNRGTQTPFTLFTKPSTAVVRQLRRIDLDFVDYAFSWDNVPVKNASVAPPTVTAKGAAPSSVARTTPSSSQESESYVTYDEFSRKASTPEQLTGKKIILENITFDTGSDKLSASSSPQLQELAGILQRYPALSVEVSGHTDNTGDRGSNFLLSQQRADAVRYYLIGEGIDPARVASIGRGQTMPIAANITALGRQANRRVELRVRE